MFILSLSKAKVREPHIQLGSHIPKPRLALFRCFRRGAFFVVSGSTTLEQKLVFWS